MSRVEAGMYAAFVYILRLHLPMLTGGWRVVDLEIVLNRPPALNDLSDFSLLVGELLDSVIYDRNRSPELASLHLADVINSLGDSVTARSEDPISPSIKPHEE